jgi:quercetin dioxygenase-like cupin family protein
MSALGANRTRQDGRNDVNDPNSDIGRHPTRLRRKALAPPSSVLVFAITMSSPKPGVGYVIQTEDRDGTNSRYAGPDLGCRDCNRALATRVFDVTQANAQQEPVKRTVLIRSDLEGIEGKEAVVFLAELAPGAVGAKHYHPGTEFFYVLEGTFAHEPIGKPSHNMKAGEVHFNPYKSVHTVRNPSTTEPTKVLGFLIADKGQPLSVPVE